MRRIATIGLAAFALSAQEPAYAADGGTGAVGREKADGGSLSAGRRPTGLPGTFLGALPPPAGQGQQGDSDPERHYPLKARANGGFSYVAPQFSAEVAVDGTVRFHDRRLRYSAPKATFSFDLFDEFVRDFGHGTLYPYDKANFLAATFTRRTKMAAKWFAAQMSFGEQELPRSLDTLWADTRYRRRERRRIICLLWEDVDTTVTDHPPSATIIEGWIRKRLPRGSPDAFTNDELDACSRDRVGGPAFTPYGSLLEMRSPSQ